MTFERLFGTYFIFCERYPMIDTILATYSILTMDKNIYHTVALKFIIHFPTFIRIEELVAVIEPCLSYCQPYSKVDAHLNKILYGNPITLNLL